MAKKDGTKKGGAKRTERELVQAFLAAVRHLMDAARDLPDGGAVQRRHLADPAAKLDAVAPDVFQLAQRRKIAVRPGWSRVQVAVQQCKNGLPTDTRALLCGLFDLQEWGLELLAALPAAAALDVVHDPRCRGVRDILRNNPPKRRKQIAADPRCQCSDTTLKNVVLPALKKADMVEQTRPRGPWRFVSDTPNSER